MHPTEGDLRAYADRELSEADLDWITGHLATCAGCQQQADELRQRALWVQNRLARVDPAGPVLSARAARARLASYPIQAKERRLMRTLPFVRSYRPPWSGLAVAAMLLIVLLFPPVRALATDFLGLFRIQRIEVVEVDTDDLGLPENMASVARFERMLSDNIQIETQGEAANAPGAAAASDLAGFAVRLPTAGVGEQRIRVEPGAQVTLTIDLPQARALLRQLGQEEAALPDSLDGQQVIVDIPQAVTASYGSCRGSEDQPLPSDPCVRLIQLPSPTVAAPTGLDMTQMGALLLQILGMSEEEATRFSQRVDWSTTLVVPLPSMHADYREVEVDGVPGTLIEQQVEVDAPRYVLLWVRDGIVYGLTGTQSADEAFALANSLE